MAATGKVLVGERAEVGLVLHGVFPILTFLFPPIDFAGTMKKVRLHISFCTWKSWWVMIEGPGDPSSEHGPLLGAQIEAEESPGWAQVATMAFLVFSSRIGHIAGLRTKGGMSWVSQQGAVCGAGENLVLVSVMLAQGQISAIMSMTT